MIFVCFRICWDTSFIAVSVKLGLAKQNQKVKNWAFPPLRACPRCKLYKMIPSWQCRNEQFPTKLTYVAGSCPEMTYLDKYFQKDHRIVFTSISQTLQHFSAGSSLYWFLYHFFKSFINFLFLQRNFFSNIVILTYMLI